MGKGEVCREKEATTVAGCGFDEEARDERKLILGGKQVCGEVIRTLLWALTHTLTHTHMYAKNCTHS